MPRLGRQCSTTVSPGFTLRDAGADLDHASPTPRGPAGAAGTCPAPLTASISLICAPQIDVCRILTSTWPDVERVRKADVVDDQRLARLHEDRRLCCLDCIGRARSFEIDEFVVAGIAEVRRRARSTPTVCRNDSAVSAQHSQIELLELVPVALDHDVVVLADALDLAARAVCSSKMREIVQACRARSRDRTDLSPNG